MPSTLVFDLDAVTSATDLPFDALDPILAGANGGALLDFDLQVGGYSFPSGAAPANGAALLDLSEVPSRNAVVTLGGTGSIGRAGNGFAFTDVVNPGNRIEGPAAVADSIWSGGAAGAQLFLAIVYLRLPTRATWVTSATYTRPVPFLTWTTAGQGPGAEPDLLNMAFVSTGQTLRANRPIDGINAAEQFDIAPADADYGSVVQLAFWRSATGQGFRLRSANSNISATKAVGVNNTTSFAGKKMQLGTGPAIWKTATSAEAKDMRIYRAYIENLALSGRNPEAVANEDFDAVFRQRGQPFS